MRGLLVGSRAYWQSVLTGQGAAVSHSWAGQGEGESVGAREGQVGRGQVGARVQGVGQSQSATGYTPRPHAALAQLAGMSARIAEIRRRAAFSHRRCWCRPAVRFKKMQFFL